MVFKRDKTVKASTAAASELKLDLGCGTKRQPGFIGIDRRPFDGVEGVTDLSARVWLFEQPMLGGVTLVEVSSGGQKRFMLPDSSVSEVYCSQFLEHLEHNQRMPERVRFMNELWRVLIPGGKATVTTPHWTSTRAFGDFTHADKPVCEMFYLYLNKEWRTENAPDNDIAFHPDGYCCDFKSQLGFSIHPHFASKSQEEQEFAVAWYKDAALDMQAVLTAIK